MFGMFGFADSIYPPYLQKTFGCILTVIYNIHVVNNILPAPTDFDMVVLIYGVWVWKGMGKKPHKVLRFDFYCLPTLKYHRLIVLNHIGLKHYKSVGSHCCEIPGTFLVQWIPKPCDFSWARFIGTWECLKSTFICVFVDGLGFVFIFGT